MNSDNQRPDADQAGARCGLCDDQHVLAGTTCNVPGAIPAHQERGGALDLEVMLIRARWFGENTALPVVESPHTARQDIEWLLDTLAQCRADLALAKQVGVGWHVKATQYAVDHERDERSYQALLSHDRQIAQQNQAMRAAITAMRGSGYWEALPDDQPTMQPQGERTWYCVPKFRYVALLAALDSQPQPGHPSSYESGATAGTEAVADG